MSPVLKNGLTYAEKARHSSTLRSLLERRKNLLRRRKQNIKEVRARRSHVDICMIGLRLVSVTTIPTGPPGVVVEPSTSSVLVDRTDNCSNSMLSCQQFCLFFRC